MSTFDPEQKGMTIDPSRDMVTRQEFERFRYGVDKEISKLREKHYEDKERMITEINQSRISNVRIEESFKSISEAVQGIQAGVLKITDKVDILANEVSDNNTQLLSLDKKVALMEQIDTKNTKALSRTEKNKEDPEDTNNNRTKIIMALFTFLGVAVPALLSKADVILDFILRISGNQK